MTDNETSLTGKKEALMTKAQIMNTIAEMIIDKIRNKEEYKDCGSWYGCFTEIEHDIEEGRKLLDSIDVIDRKI